MSKKTPKKPKLFQLTAMERLVEVVPFLENKRQQLEDKVRPLLGYHWNEVVQNILFNRYVKPNQKLLGRYQILLHQYRQERAVHKANKASKKLAQPAAAELPAELSAPTQSARPTVGADGKVDTRLTNEQTTGGAGYSYETPNFLSPSSGAFRRQSKSMAHLVGATLLENTTIQFPYPMTPAAELLCNPQHLDWLLENYFSSTGGGGQATSQLRLNEIKTENERSAAAQLKQAVSQERKFSEKLSDGSTQVKVTDEVEGVDPIRPQMENATKALTKRVALNRDLNELDQTLIAQPDLPKTLLDRYREQAGDVAFEASLEKVKQYRKENPSDRPPGRTQIVKESWLVGKDTQGNLHRFDAGTLRHVNELPQNVTRLETRGLANGQALLRESHEFYVNLADNDFMCIPLNQAPAPAPARIDRALHAHLKQLVNYRSAS